MTDNFALSFENLSASTRSVKKAKALLYNITGYVEKGGITAGNRLFFPWSSFTDDR